MLGPSTIQENGEEMSDIPYTVHLERDNLANNLVMIVMTVDDSPEQELYYTHSCTYTNQ